MKCVISNGESKHVFIQKKDIDYLIALNLYGDNPHPENVAGEEFVEIVDDPLLQERLQSFHFIPDLGDYCNCSTEVCASRLRDNMNYSKRLAFLAHGDDSPEALVELRSMAETLITDAVILTEVRIAYDFEVLESLLTYERNEISAMFAYLEQHPIITEQLINMTERPFAKKFSSRT